MSFKFSLALLIESESRFLERYDFSIPPELNQESIKKLKDNEPELMRIYEKLRQLPKPTTPYFCSSEYAVIRGACTEEKTISLSMPSEPEVKDRILGGWLGRASGCVLGKPLECSLTLPEIKDFLGAEFPIDNYLRLSTAKQIVLKKKPQLHPYATVPCSRENIAYAMEDDDLDYTTLNLLLLEQNGFSFSTRDIGKTWATHLPPSITYGAETTAFVNYLWGLPIDLVPVYLNPFRDEIGAQIRADMFGFVCPAQPQAAAELAFRDASFSHVADGIYGAMFVSAMIAAAFSANSMKDIISVGMTQIPKHSRIAELITQTLEWHSKFVEWEAVYEKIKAATPQYHEGHTVNNAAYVVNALLTSNGDFEKGIAIASMQGHDSDCNGATVGSILGTYLGAKCLPDKWIRPLNDCLKTNLRGLSSVAISELAERSFRLALQRMQS
ncbi:MAG: ADP-ribosylglycohydrolase family protein [Planctomycetota bacterium]